MSIVRAVAVLKLNKVDKLGNVPIYIRITKDRKSKFYTTGCKCKLSEWDADKMEVSDQVDNHILINMMINKEILKIEELVLTNKIIGRTMTITAIKIHSTGNREAFDFYELCKDMLKEAEGPNENNFKFHTVKNFRTNIKILKAFRNAINVADIDLEFLKLYKDFLVKKGNVRNTISHRMLFLRKMLTIAIVKKLLSRDDDPFVEFKHSFKAPRRQYLEMEEVRAIEKYLLTTELRPHVRATGWNFIVSCYCGLRFSDIGKFDFDNNIAKNRMIVRTSKAGTDVSILIHSRLAIAIKNARSAPPLNYNAMVHRDLQMIAKRSNITKHMSFHTGRHTFAVECATLGISMEVVQQLLGHTRISSTEIYYKIVNPRIDKEMEKWEIAQVV